MFLGYECISHFGHILLRTAHDACKSVRHVLAVLDILACDHIIFLQFLIVFFNEFIHIDIDAFQYVS